MRTLKPKSDAATSTTGNRLDKKSINVKASPLLNFLLGVTAMILVAFVILELQTPIRETSYPLFPNKEMAMEVNMDQYRIEKPQPVIEPKKKESPKPITPTKIINKDKAPIIIEDDVLDPVEDPTPVTVDQPINDKPISDTPIKDPVLSKPSNFNVKSVSEVPLFPGCSSSLDSEERISCLNEKMGRYIQRKFDTSLANSVNGKDVVAITVLFTIGTDGYPKDIQVRAPNPALEKEARQLIAGLPQMKPGKFDGAVVNTTYALPIYFKVQ